MRTIRPFFAPLLALFGLGAVLPGCGGENIPNTDVPDNAENRAVISFVEDYRHAVERRDVGGILALVSPRFFDDNGTINSDDDRDFEALSEQIARFSQLLDVRYEMRYRRVTYHPDRILVDYTYTASFKVATPQGDRWETRLRDNRIELVREEGEFRIISGI
ncbi:MAG: hypothetical protein AB7S26_24540 [Sandaracinaceae bacterium]